MGEPEYLRVRNFERYQVYKDGRPTKFIALWATTDAEHTGVLDNPDFLDLADDPECPVFQMMVLAARMHNRIPNRPEWLRGILGCSRPISVEKMLNANFLQAHPDSESAANKPVRDSTLREVNRSEVKTTEEANASSSETRKIFEHWQVARDKPHSRLTERRRAKIKTRLRSFSADELIRAIDAVALDPWEDRPRHDDLLIILRSDEQVEKFLAFADNPPKRTGPTRLRDINLDDVFAEPA